MYTFKPRVEQSAKKLQQWITKVNLVSTSMPEGYDQGASDAAPELDEEGNPVPKKQVV